MLLIDFRIMIVLKCVSVSGELRHEGLPVVLGSVSIGPYIFTISLTFHRWQKDSLPQ